MVNPGIAAVVVSLAESLFDAGALADRFELVTYTPPAGWSVQQDATGRLYRRQDGGGTGVAVLFTARAASGAPAATFALEWREKVQPLVSAAAPSPQLRAVGELTAAIGGTRAKVNGADVAVSFVTFVGRGRAVSVLGIASSDEVQQQLLAFFDTLNVAADAPAGEQPPRQPPPVAAGGELDLEVEAPSGYVARREASGLVLTPTNRDQTPCAYAVTPPRPSRGAQEADAQAAWAELFAGWQKSRAEEQSYVKRGVAPGGWPFYWYRADLHRDGGAQREHAIGMVMVVPAGPRRVSVVYGLGDLARCTFEDRSFAQLFNGLRPKGVAADGGKAFARELVGSWIFSTTTGNHNSMLYVFDADGSYAFGLSAVTSRIEVSESAALEQRARLGQHGRYAVRGNVLELQRDGRDRPERYRARIMDERSLGMWTRALYLTDESGNDVQYLRQNWRGPQ